MKVIWSPLAVERVWDIAEYISHESLSATQKLVIGIFDRAGKLERWYDRLRTDPPTTGNRTHLTVVWG